MPPGGCCQIHLHYHNSYFNSLSFLKVGIIFAILRNGEKSDTCNMLLKLSKLKNEKISNFSLIILVGISLSGYILPR